MKGEPVTAALMYERLHDCIVDSMGTPGSPKISFKNIVAHLAWNYGMSQADIRKAYGRLRYHYDKGVKEAMAIQAAHAKLKSPKEGGHHHEN